MNVPQRTAIVTGGARGIGAAVSRRLAADGYQVAVLDLDEAACAATVAAVEDLGSKAIAVGADVADEAAVQSAVDRVASDLGAPTVLVNNAGITRDNLLFKMSTVDWDSVMNVHLRGAFLMSRAAQQHMTEAGWGRIVNLSSISALGNRGQANYSAAKAGLQGFTKTLAIELGRYGVTVNAIAPGFIATEMTAATADRLGHAVRGVQGRPTPSRSRSAGSASPTTSPTPCRSSPMRPPASSRGRCSTSRGGPDRADALGGRGQATKRMTTSATHTGFSAASHSTDTRTVTCVVPVLAWTSTISAVDRTRDPTGTGAGNLTFSRP